MKSNCVITRKDGQYLKPVRGTGRAHWQPQFWAFKNSAAAVRWCQQFRYTGARIEPV